MVHCCEVALWLRERLARDGIEAYAKTSGSKGLHLLAAVRGAPSEQVSDYAKALAVEAERAMPRLVLHQMKRSLRPGKVFVDWSQNAARKTTATPYTLRARPEPLVSAPVTWEEVEECRSRTGWPCSPRTSPAGAGPRRPAGPLLDPDHAGTLP